MVSSSTPPISQKRPFGTKQTPRKNHTTPIEINPKSYNPLFFQWSLPKCCQFPPSLGRYFFTKNLPFGEEDFSMMINLFCFFVFGVLATKSAILTEFEAIFQKFFIFSRKIISVLTHGALELDHVITLKRHIEKYYDYNLS
jgi:hypothetical protein